MPRVSLQDRLQQRMLVGDLEAGVLAQRLAAFDVGVDGTALDRAGADQGDLHGQVVEVCGLGTGQHLHLRPALDLKDAGGLRGPDRFEGRLVVERDAREVDPLAAHPLDFHDAALDRREHPQAEQVDLQEAGVGAGVLVPLDDLAALHRRRHHRADVDQRPGGDHHPAGMLGGVAGQADRLAAERDQRAPARRAGALGTDRAGDMTRSISPASPWKPTVLATRSISPAGRPSALPRSRTRAARAIGGEGGDQRRSARAVALVDAEDQLLADVAREVDVDVGASGHFLV